MKDGIFVDPDNLLPRLRRELLERRRVVLTGMGGIGKSTLAYAYVRTYVKDYSGSIIVNAQSRDSILDEFFMAVRDVHEVTREVQIYKDAMDDPQRKKAMAGVRDRILSMLKTRQYERPDKPYLLVYQGVDDPGDYLLDYFDADATSYHVLFTSRRQDFDTEIAARFPVPLMPEEKAVELLCLYGGLDKAAFQALSGQEQSAARQLATQTAGCLPLALKAIGKTYQRKEFTTFTGFLALLRADTESRKRTFGYDPSALDRRTLPTEDGERNHPSIFDTYRVCFNLATDARRPGGAAEAVADLLHLLAVLAPECIPQNLIEEAAAAGSLGGPLGSLSTRARGIQDAIRTADDCSLIDWLVPSNGDKSLSMHSVVQEVLKMDMDDARTQQAVERGRKLIDAALSEAWRMNELNGLATLFPHARALLDYGADAVQFEHLAAFRADLQVQEALKNGDWSSVFADRPGEAPSYSTFRNMETSEWRQRMQRIVASLHKAVPDAGEARQCFACIYFLAHYWWDSYIEEKDHAVVHLVEPVVQAWEACQTEAADRRFVAALREFQQHYPCLRNYHGRDARSADWNSVYRALTELCGLLNVDLGPLTPERRKAFSPSKNYLVGILSLYKGEALSYATEAKERRPGDNPAVWRLYEQAKELFQANDDDFHLSWALFQEADRRSEAGIYLGNHRDWLGRPGNHVAQFAEAEKEAEEALRIAANLTGESQKSAGGGAPSQGASTVYESDLDAELIANAYRVLGDVRRWTPGREETAWGCSCAAMLAAYAFMESQQDEYAQQFYQEMVDRLLDDLLDPQPRSDNDRIRTVLICRFLQDFWREYWRSHALPTPDFQPALEARDRGGLERSLFPPAPALDELRNPDSGCRRCLSRVLESAPDVVAGMHPLFRPILLEEVVAILRDESRKLNASAALWALDEAPGLFLRPVRREEIDTLATLAERAFGNAHDSALVRAMLNTHCDTAPAIALDSIEHTMMPTQYYTLALMGVPIGLTGLYRIVWAGRGVFSLGWFFVAPEHQRKGFGERLLLATMQIAAKQGGKRLVVETEPGLTAAIGLYKKVGFEPVGTVPDYYAPDSDLLLMTCDLARISAPEATPERVA